jgi:ectoine hydroxylase-related dioxygenase (phytanoyl-CoA dioxygenase family)
MPTDDLFTDATPLLADPVALQAQMDRDGFFYFKGLFPQEDVLDLRRQILTICQKHGWLAPDAPLMDGLASPAAEDIQPWCGVGVTQAAYADVYKLEAFHRLAQHANILSVMKLLLGETVLPHPRHIARLMFPVKANAPTPPHQDHIFIQGSKTAYTCWLPLGDVSQALGGLQVARGSHQYGLLPVRAAEGAGGRTVILDGLEPHWMRGDFTAGDVLIFHSLTVHRSVPNTLPGRLRLSVDYRYQGVSLPIEYRSLRPHCDVLSWEEVYADWHTTDLRYYWQQHPLTMQAFDDALLTAQMGM